MITVFWLSLGIIFYTYAGYPFVLLFLGMIMRKGMKNERSAECGVRSAEWGRESLHSAFRTPNSTLLLCPSVSIIIAAHNEEFCIHDKLANTLALDYPRDRTEVIVISDGSTDRTDAIAAGFAAAGVRTEHLPERSGKSAALNLGVSLARGDILVFTDAGAIAEPDCLWRLASHFSDPEIGCVSSEDAITGGSSGEGAYVKYEMLLRRLETKVGSCTAVSGSFYAIRRELCLSFPPAAATDFLSVLETVRRGFRAISDPHALARMGTVGSGDEFRRKVRTVLTGVACLPAMLPLLNPFRHGLFSIELVSHKLLRWTAGAFLLPLLVNSAFLVSESPFYAAVLLSQALFYILGFLGALSPRILAASRAVRYPYFFLCTNLSALFACWKYLRGERIAIWQPSRRAKEARV
ncbi:MAG: glycosyltransferase [Armatimonadetes bacterium]|nr:glycosyltransferase [Armatimonadota bacterium]